jgi:signal transduction histidine kinase
MSRKLKKIKAPAFSYIVLGYMLLAFLWWAILLNRQNVEIRQLREELRTQVLTEGLSQEQITRDFEQERIMIWGEGFVFILALFVGFWLINKSYTREIEVAKQKRNFLLAITHELRSPLASIKLILETFNKRKLKPSEEKQMWQNGLMETERLQRLIDNILLASTLERSYLPEKGVVDLAMLIDQQIEYMQKFYPKASISRIDGNQSVVLTIDEFGLTSIIRNYLENALKYTKPPQRVELDLKRNKKGWKIEVKDNGPGVPPEEQKKIFWQFYRVGSEETRTTTGTGLGLFIVKRISDINGWETGVSVNPAGGSIFSLWVPTT